MFDANGQFLRKFSSRCAWPVGVAVDTDDNIMVLDKQTDLVHIFEPDGFLLTTFRGSECLCVDCDGRIIVGSGRWVNVYAFLNLAMSATSFTFDS